MGRLCGQADFTYDKYVGRGPALWHSSARIEAFRCEQVCAEDVSTSPAWRSRSGGHLCRLRASWHAARSCVRSPEACALSPAHSVKATDLPDNENRLPRACVFNSPQLNKETRATHTGRNQGRRLMNGAGHNCCGLTPFLPLAACPCREGCERSENHPPHSLWSLSAQLDTDASSGKFTEPKHRRAAVDDPRKGNDS